jgi:hypothetical protein
MTSSPGTVGLQSLEARVTALERVFLHYFSDAADELQACLIEEIDRIKSFELKEQVRECLQLR